MSGLKKIFIFSSISLVIVLFLGSIYFLAFKKQSPSLSEQSNTPFAKTESKSGTTKDASDITAASTEAVLAPILIEDDLYVEYYSKADGQVYRTDLNGNNKKTISNKQLTGLSGVFWSPDKKQVISKFQKEGNPAQFFHYNYDDLSNAPLKNNLDRVVWQNNNRILYKYFDPKTQERTLNIADPDGKNWLKLADLEFKNVSIASVPQSSLVSFWNQPDANSETVLKSISALGGEPQIIFTGNFGTDYLWSNDGNYLLTSSSDKKGGSKVSLAIINSQGKEYRNLNIPTLISKVVWSKDNKTAFYALPGAVPNNSVMPNDYLSGKIKTTDTFWKINIASGEKTRIVELDKIKNQFDATDLFLNANESLLFFINRLDNKLYKINL